MRRRELKVGHIYGAKVRRRLVPVRLLYGVEKYGKPTRWVVENLETGREMAIKSASRFRCEMAPDADGKLWRIAARGEEVTTPLSGKEESEDDKGMV
jgi:hypothetical protein